MKKVLVAEDDPAIAALITDEIAERLGVSCQLVLNGALVLDALASHHPDLVVLDLALPGLSGLDVFDLIRNDPTWGGIPVLFLTADPERAETARSHVGEHRVMGKPFDLDALVSQIAALLSEGAEAAA